MLRTVDAAQVDAVDLKAHLMGVEAGALTAITGTLIGQTCTNSSATLAPRSESRHCTMHSSHLLHPLALFRRRARQPRVGEVPRSPRDGLGPERRRDDDEDLQARRRKEQPGVEQRLDGAAD